MYLALTLLVRMKYVKIDPGTAAVHAPASNAACEALSVASALTRCAALDFKQVS